MSFSECKHPGFADGFAKLLVTQKTVDTTSGDASLPNALNLFRD